MRPIAFALPTLLAVLSLLPAPAGATGFGWYACSVEWKEFVEEVDGMRLEADELLAASDTPQLRQHLQLEADSTIARYCEEWGKDETPSGASLYSTSLAAYASAAQKRAGVNNSYFRRFANPPETITIEKRTDRPFIDPVYFTLSPADVRAFHAELVAMNRRQHPPEYASVLRFLEAVLVKTMNDDWASWGASDVAREYGNGERGLIFYGHD